MSPTAVLYVSQAIHGLAYGMLLFLVASGLTLIFGMMGILNVAHASFYMLAGYFCYQILQMTGNFWLALLVAPVAAGIIGVLVERFLLRPVHKGGHLAELLLTVGLGFKSGDRSDFLDNTGKHASTLSTILLTLFTRHHRDHVSRKVSVQCSVLSVQGEHGRAKSGWFSDST